MPACSWLSWRGAPGGSAIKLEERWGDFRAGRNWEALDRHPDGRLVLGYDDAGASFLAVFAP